VCFVFCVLCFVFCVLLLMQKAWRVGWGVFIGVHRCVFVMTLFFAGSCVCFSGWGVCMTWGVPLGDDVWCLCEVWEECFCAVMGMGG